MKLSEFAVRHSNMLQGGLGVKLRECAVRHCNMLQGGLE